mmetsp:Transcript_3733/g.12083  ORF Transcript_3733/g.12083 Transcript_3733/m.12083 type:complete len:207 (+) Transcript_3733:174-794(+)
MPVGGGTGTTAIPHAATTGLSHTMDVSPLGTNNHSHSILHRFRQGSQHTQPFTRGQGSPPHHLVRPLHPPSHPHPRTRRHLCTCNLSIRSGGARTWKRRRHCSCRRVRPSARRRDLGGACRLVAAWSSRRLAAGCHCHRADSCCAVGCVRLARCRPPALVPACLCAVQRAVRRCVAVRHAPVALVPVVCPAHMPRHPNHPLSASGV